MLDHEDARVGVMMIRSGRSRHARLGRKLVECRHRRNQLPE